MHNPALALSPFLRRRKSSHLAVLDLIQVFFLRSFVISVGIPISCQITKQLLLPSEAENKRAQIRGDKYRFFPVI